MLDKPNQKKGLPKKPLILAAAVILAVSLVFLGMFVFDAIMNKNAGATGAQSTVTQVKNTAFDGSKVNEADPDAIKQYCEDIKQTRTQVGAGANIRDLCVLDSVAKNWLPLMTSDEIEKMLNEEPTCFETEYDSMGYHCFTGFNEDGCNRAGMTEDGKSCQPEPVKVKADPFSTVLPENVCDILAGCEEERVFGPDGMNEFGCDRQGRDKNGDMCPAEFITRIYDDNQRDQLGFDRKGFNENGCDIRGNREDGTQCSIDEITRVYDKNKRDQFGFDVKGFNENNCDINGLKPDGSVCSISEITRVYDPITGLDQFNLDKDGFNAAGCSLEGVNRQGELCDIDDIPRIFGTDGKDQFGLRKNNRNEFNCDLDGFKPDGSICPVEQRTSIFSPYTGKDQFGFFENGMNDFDCDVNGLKPDGSICPVEQRTTLVNPKTGLDINNLDADGYAENGCSIQGFRRDGSRCEIKDIPLVFDAKTGLNQFGVSETGFNDKNCNFEGFREDGSKCDFEDIPKIYDPVTGADQFGLNKDGFNENNCDINGLRPDGSICPIDEVTKIYDPVTGADQFGLNKDGFSIETGCDLQGFRVDGSRCDYDDIPKIWGADGINQLGVDKDKRNSNGCDLAGRKPDGSMCTEEEMTVWYDDSGISPFHKDKDGFGRLGFNELLFNENNCDINGLKPDGTVCSVDDITRVFNPETGLDQFGLGKDGFNSYGCSLEGLNREGEKCDEALIPRIFGKDGVDQFGNHISELDDEVWSKGAVPISELTPLLDENGNPVVLNGKSVYVDEQGRLRDPETGLLLTDENGNVVRVNAQGDLVTDDGLVKKGPFKSGVATETKLTQLLDEEGNPVTLDGKAVYIDDNGYARDPLTGDLIVDENGSPIKVDSQGNLVSGSGLIKKGPFKKGETITPLDETKELAPLLDGNGKPVLIDGKPVYVDENGYARDPISGELILDESGNAIRLDENGNLVSGSKIAKKGPFKQGAKMTALLDENGKPVTINGKPVLIDENGFARDAITGELMLDENGDPIRLDENGDLVSDSGIIKKGPFKNGDKITQLLDENGNPVMVDGKPVYIDEEGFVRDPETGELVFDENGDPIKLDSNGDLVSLSGIAKKGPFKRSEALSPLLDSNGELVTIDGKPVYIDENGYARDAITGELMLDDSGSPIKLDENGNLVSATGFLKEGPFETSGSISALVDENGNPVLFNGKPVYVDENGLVRNPITGELVLDENGNPILLDENGDLISSGVVSNGPFKKGRIVKPLVDSEGNPVTLDGKPVYVDEDGFIRDPMTGELMLDEEGNPIRLNDAGDLVSPLGIVKKGPFKKAASPSPLLDENGNPVILDGKRVYVDENGNIRDMETGQIVTTKDGTPLEIDENGNIVAGDKLLKKGPFKSANVDLPKLTKLLDKSGKPVLINGKPVYVDKDGFARDPLTGELILAEDGTPIRIDENGDIVSDTGVIKKGPFKKGAPLTALLDENGNVLKVNGKAAYVDSDGNIVDMETGEILTDKDGNPVFLDENGDLATKAGVLQRGPFTKAKSIEDKKRPMLGENGEPVYFNGEPVYVDELGRLKDKNGDFILGPDGEPLKMNEFGQVVTTSGQVIPSTAFTDVNGEKMNGSFTSGELMSQHELEALEAASKLTQSQRDAFGIDVFGYNAAGCSLNGLNKQGEICDYEYIPKLIDPVTGFDQFGFKDKYNIFGCDIRGLDRQGNACKEEHITRITDAKDRDQFGKDQAGFGENGLNDLGVNALGCDAMGQGEGCSEEYANKLYDDAGVNQFHQSKDGKDRLGLVNGFNDKGCGLDGLNRLGKTCALEDIPRIFDENDLDQFGLNSKGYNRFNCNLEGKRPDGTLCPDNQITRIYDKNNRDQFGLTPLRRNDKGCGIDGFTPEGELCEFDDIPKVIDTEGKDQFGFFPDGFNEKGCDINGLDRSGEVCPVENITRIYNPITGLDQFNLDEDGFNAAGCSLEGLNRQGELCSPADVPRIYGEDGKDQFGFFESGFNDANCDYYGYDKNGKLCSADDLTRVFDEKSVDQFGVSEKTNVNENGCGLDGRNKFGKICKPSLQVKFKKSDGKDQFGFINDFNENGCDINGLREDGTRCEHKDITRIISPETGLDQLGLNENAVNDAGCSLSGLKADGTPCEPENLTHWVDGNGKDQFGLNADKLNEKGCNLLGYKADGTRCEVEDAPAIYGDDGFSQLGFNIDLLDREGYGVDNLDSDGCDRNNLDKDGNRCSAYQGLDLSVDDAEYMEERRKIIADWLKNAEVVTTDISDGTYAFVEPEVVEVQSKPVDLIGIKDGQSEGVNQQSGAGGQEVGNGQIEIPVGLMALVHVKTPINSDYSQDVYGTLLGTAMDGATLKGTIEVPYIDDPVMPRDKFRYVFTHIIWNRKSYPINAVSINVGDNSGMVEADDVSYHRWQRYGGLVVASAVQALDASFLDSEEQQLVEDQTEQNALLYSQIYGDNTLNLTKQNLQVATSHISDLAKEQFTRRPTIEKGAGQHIIIFREEVDNDELPMLFSELE